MVSMDDIVNNPKKEQTIDTTPINIIKTNVVSKTQQKPIILKPIAFLKGSNQHGEVRSHIKIGNNVFAVIHNSDNTTLQTITSTVTPVQTPKNTVQSTSNLQSPVELQSRPAKRPHCNLDEHDYADEEDNDSFESTGVSKVNDV